MEFDDWMHKFFSDHPTFVAVVGGTIVGLMATLGRALNAGIFPDRRWWAVRFLTAGFFALTSAYAAEAGHLTTTGTAFLNSLLILMGFAAIEAIEKRALQVLDGTKE
jgi:hypothetical protein